MRAARQPGPAMIPAGLDAAIVLLRHGESVAITEGRFQGRLDSPLSPLGQRQADLAADRLAWPDRPPVLPVPARAPVEIVHSPLGRTAATATAAAAALLSSYGAGAVPLPRPDPGLLEVGQGAWEGLHRDQVVERYGDILEGWRRDPVGVHAPGGEALADVAIRARGALERVLATLAGAAPGEPATGAGRVSVSGYPGATAATTPWTLLVGHDGIFKVVLLTLLGLPLDRFWAFPFGLTGLTIVELHGGRPVLRAHNLLGHLAALQASLPAAEGASESAAERREQTGAL